MYRKKNSELRTITIIGTLPPIKGISPYCLELITAISKYTPLEFIGFSKLYPNFLYPGGKTTEDGASYNMNTPINGITIRNFLTYYDPISWIWAGLTIQGTVIHAQWWSSVLAPLYFTVLSICKLRHKKIVITVHNVIPHENSVLNRFLDSLILNFGDFFIVHSLRNISELHKTFRIPNEKIIRIPIGIFESYKDSIVTADEAREKLDLPKNSRIILFFGHIRDYKGLDIMLESLIYIANRIENVILVIAGSPWVQWEKYENFIEKNDLNKNVRLYLKFIPTSEAKYFYYASDIVVLPYKRFSAQSAAGAVALTFEKPLIVTNVGGLSELVKDKNFVVTPNNSHELAEKIVLILNDVDLIKKLSNDSKDLAKEYSWDEIARKTIELYKSLEDKYENISNLPI